MARASAGGAAARGATARPRNSTRRDRSGNVLTSNNARELSDALKRRCLHLYIDYPTRERELAIVRSRLPGVPEKLAEQVVTAVGKLRKLELKKSPSIAETLDWAQALVLLNADPTTDINHAKQIALVIRNGVVVDRATLDLPVNHRPTGAR